MTLRNLSIQKIALLNEANRLFVKVKNIFVASELQVNFCSALNSGLPNSFSYSLVQKVDLNRESVVL